MSWEHKQFIHGGTHTDLDTWVNTTLIAVGPSNDRLKMKNLTLRGSYSIDQSTESNTQFGAVVIALYRISDQVATPDVDIASTGIERRILKMMYVITGGENNPVIFSLHYRAVNVRPGEKLMLSSQAKLESTSVINHRVNMIGSHWTSDD